MVTDKAVYLIQNRWEQAISCSEITVPSVLFSNSCHLEWSSSQNKWLDSTALPHVVSVLWNRGTSSTVSVEDTCHVGRKWCSPREIPRKQINSTLLINAHSCLCSLHTLVQSFIHLASAKPLPAEASSDFPMHPSVVAPPGSRSVQRNDSSNAIMEWRLSDTKSGSLPRVLKQLHWRCAWLRWHRPRLPNRSSRKVPRS